MSKQSNRNGQARILSDDAEMQREGFISRVNKDTGDGDDKNNKHHPEGIERSAPMFVMELWSDWANERITKEATWVECEKAYLSKHTAANNQAKWKSKAFVPVSYNAVENIHAQLMSGLFPNANDFFDVVELEEEYALRAGVVKEMLAHQLNQSEFRAEFAHFVKQLITIGNSAAIVDWHDDNAGFHSSRFATLDMKYFHVDPYASDPTNANKIRRYWMTFAEASASGMFDDEALEDVRNAASRGADSQEDANRTAAAQASELTQGIDPHRGNIEITELWGTFEIDGTIYENHVVSIGNKSEVLRFEKSPYLHGKDPFIFTRYSVVAGEVYGIGALEPALPLQYLINTFTNQKVDELSIIINGMFKFKDDGVIDIDNLIAEPGACFEVGDMDNLQPIQPGGAVSLAYNEIADLERKFEEATGALKLVAGGAQGAGDRTTATEVMALTQSGNARFNETLAHIENTALSKALRKYVSNAAQFMKRNFVIKAVGADDAKTWLSISKDDLQGQYAIKMGGSKLVGVRELRLRNIMQYAQTIGGIEELKARMDWEKFDKKLWRELGFDNDMSMLKPAEDVQPPADMVAMMQQQGGQPQQPDMNPQMAQVMGGVTQGDTSDEQ